MYTCARAQLDKYRFLESISHSAEAAYTYRKQIEYWEDVVKAEEINPLRVYGLQLSDCPFPTVTKGD